MKGEYQVGVWVGAKRGPMMIWRWISYVGGNCEDSRENVVEVVGVKRYYYDAPRD